MTSILSNRARHINICEQAVYFWRKASANGDVVSLMNYEGNGEVPAKRRWLKNEMERFSRLCWPKKVFVPVTRQNDERKVG